MELTHASNAGLLEPSAPLAAQPHSGGAVGHAVGTASSSSASGGATAATALAAAPMQSSSPTSNTAILKVMVPEGVAPGQRVAFTTPCCQNLQVTVPDGLTPGATVRVQYTPLPGAAPAPRETDAPSARPAAGPPLPLPAVQMTAAELDQRASNNAWAWLAGSCALLCCCPSCFCCVPFVWLWVAGSYYCKPVEEQSQRPQQRMPALLALVSCISLTAAGCMLAAGAVGFGIGASTHMNLPFFGPGHCETGTALLSDGAVCPFGYHFPETAESCAAAAKEVGHEAVKSVQENCTSLPCSADIVHGAGQPMCSVLPDDKYRVVFAPEGSDRPSASEKNKALCVCNSESPHQHGHHDHHGHHDGHHFHGHPTLFSFNGHHGHVAAEDFTTVQTSNWIDV